MKKENDEITDLFRTRLADAGMNVRDCFWEELSQEIPVACQQRRRLLLFRVAAAVLKLHISCTSLSNSTVIAISNSSFSLCFFSLLVLSSQRTIHSVNLVSLNHYSYLHLPD